MNINILQSNNPYLNKIEQIQRSKQQKVNLPKSSNETITNNEVKYFQKMFPANAEHIENYVTFNRNGIVVNSEIKKGTIIDIIV